MTEREMYLAINGNRFINDEYESPIEVGGSKFKKELLCNGRVNKVNAPTSVGEIEKKLKAIKEKERKLKAMKEKERIEKATAESIKRNANNRHNQLIVSKQNQSPDGTKITSVIFNHERYNNNIINIFRLDNGWTGTEDYKKDKVAMHKREWAVLHSPKLHDVTICTDWYSKDLHSIISYCEMQSIPVDIRWDGDKLTSSKEFMNKMIENLNNQQQVQLSFENVSLIRNHARELIRFVKNPFELEEVLQSQIKLSGYDVSLSSSEITDGLNHGIIEDNGKPVEWSREYTKHYERYNQHLNDLLLMYINCKFYKSVGFEPDNNVVGGVGLSEVDSYTGITPLDPWTDAPFRSLLNASDYIRNNNYDDIVVPVSACSDTVKMHCN